MGMLNVNVPLSVIVCMHICGHVCRQLFKMFDEYTYVNEINFFCGRQLKQMLISESLLNIFVRDYFRVECELRVPL
jgi:hypothetical protein